MNITDAAAANTVLKESGALVVIESVCILLSFVVGESVVLLNPAFFNTFSLPSPIFIYHQHILFSTSNSVR
jgi:hypothetical protein